MVFKAALLWGVLFCVCVFGFAGCNNPAPAPAPTATASPDELHRVALNPANSESGAPTPNVFITSGTVTVCLPSDPTKCTTVNVSSSTTPTPIPPCDSIAPVYPCVEQAAPPVIPTVAPTALPSMIPTLTPTIAPTPPPIETIAPTATPTMMPTIPPTVTPTVAPTMVPTAPPTVTPTMAPTMRPTSTPQPTAPPTQQPTSTPQPAPTANPIPPIVINGSFAPIMVGGLRTFQIEQGSFKNGFTCTSSNPSVATCGVSGNELVLRGNSSGTTTITVKGNGAVTSLSIKR